MKFAIQAHPLYSATYFLILALGLKRLKQKSTMLIEKRQLDCKSLLALLRWRSLKAPSGQIRKTVKRSSFYSHIRCTAPSTFWFWHSARNCYILTKQKSTMLMVKRHLDCTSLLVHMHVRWRKAPSGQIRNSK